MAGAVIAYTECVAFPFGCAFADSIAVGVTVEFEDILSDLNVVTGSCS